MVYYALPTSWGDFAIAPGTKGLLGLHFPGWRGVCAHFSQLPAEFTGQYEEAAVQLREYLEGKRKKFSMKLDISGATVFRQQVWKALMRIKFADTVSYSDIAAAIGNNRAVRAVGGACGANPLPVFIPCHRVLAKNSLGGFSSGLEVKVKLLEHEKNFF